MAIVITEPAMTNNQGLILPLESFHDALRAITRETGTLLAYDETHTQVVGPGGLTRTWGLEPDVITVGKSIAAGVPTAAYGMTDAVADVLQAARRPRQTTSRRSRRAARCSATRSSMAAARATLSEVLTADAYAHTQRLGARLADGIEKTIAGYGLPWTVHRFWPRSGFTFAPEMPRDAGEAWATFDVPLRRLLRVYMANRGIWDAIVGAGPTCSIPATDEDVDAYVGVFAGAIAELTG